MKRKLIPLLFFCFSFFILNNLYSTQYDERGFELYESDSDDSSGSDGGDDSNSSEETDNSDSSETPENPEDSEVPDSSPGTSSNNSSNSSSSSSEPSELPGANAELEKIANEESSVSADLEKIINTEVTESVQLANEEPTEIDFAKAEEGTEIKNLENEEKLVDETNSKEAEKPGDPVKISKGTYELTETDLQIGFKNQFNIKRRYESDNTVTGSFGYGWITNLDERIILGVDSKLDERIKEIKIYKDALEQCIYELENKILEHYQVSSIENAEEEIKSEISQCEALIDRIDELLQSLDDFMENVRGRGDYEEKAKKRKTSVEALKERILSKKDNLENLLSLFLSDNEKLIALENKRTFVSEQLSIIQEQKEDEEFSHSRNKRVLFSGMRKGFEEIGNNKIILIDEDGYPHTFQKTSENYAVWENRFEKDYLKFEYVNNVYKLYLRDGSVKVFNSDGFIIRVYDRNNNSVEIKRKSDGRIEFIKTSFSEQFRVEYSGNLISKITNVRSSEELVRYSYKNNLLASVTDTDGDKVSMDYDSAGHLIKLKKCDGSFVSLVYNEQTKNGDILTTSTINEEGYAEYFEYFRNQNRTDYIDHDGNRTRYWYDENQHTKKKILPDGTVINNTYDDYGNLIVKEENENVTRYSYDSNNNLIQIRYSDSSSEFWSYDKNNLLLSYTDRDGVIEQYIRDNNGNLIEYRKANKTAFTQQFNLQGLVTTRVDYGQNPIVTNYEYDNYGNLIKEKTGDREIKYTHDNRNRLINERIDNQEIYSYSYADHKTTFTDYKGLETQYITNGRKDLVKVIQKDLQSSKVHVMQIDYDKRHLPINVFAGSEDSLQLIMSYLYSPEGKITGIINYGNESWIKLINYKNEKISEVKQFKISDADIVSKINSSNPITFEVLKSYLLQSGENVLSQKYEYKQTGNNENQISVFNDSILENIFAYDSFGNLIKITDGNNEHREIKYSKAGRIIKEKNLYGGWYEYDYGAEGLLKLQSEEGSQGMAYEYYPDGSKKSEKDCRGNITNYKYDSLGRVAAKESVHQKVWYEYDKLNRLKKISIGKTLDEQFVSWFASYNYSSDGRKITVIEGGKYKNEYDRDAFGNVVRITDGNGNSKSYEYNYLNQLISIYDGYGNQTKIQYNALNKIDNVTLPEGNKLSYSYNYAALLEKISDECGIVFNAEYDKRGRLIKEFNRADCEKSYEYDNAGHLIQIKYGDEIVESYEYGNYGRNLKVTDGNGAKYLYNYDVFGRLKNERNRSGYEQSYSYDEEGKLKNVICFDGSIISYVTSSDRTIQKEMFSDGSLNVITLDEAENIEEAQNAHGKTVYKYDQGGRLIYQKDITTGEEVEFEYDDAGNRIRLISSNRDTIYSYGKNNEVKEVFDNKQRLHVKLSYNNNGQEVVRDFGNGTKEQTHYDKAGRVIVKTLKADNGSLLWGEGYVYGPNGKRTATVDFNGRVTFYEYNSRGQISEIYYPYSNELIDKLNTEASECGLPATNDYGENRYMTSAEKSALIPLLNSMQYGFANKLSNLQIFIKEKYTYDKNGNRKTKTTASGTIEYTYDNDNCLIASGSHGQSYIQYSYDKLGNLLSEESADKKISYAYNSQNRLIYCEVIDHAEKTCSQTSYAYDVFGRRIIVQDKDQCALRTLYDGFTFDVIKQSPTYANGLFTDSYETGIRWTENGRPTGDRYRYLSDEKSSDDNRYFYLDEGIYKSVSHRYKGERTQLSVNGIIAAQSTADYGVEYFSTDLLGSVASITDNLGLQKTAYSYDVFGFPISGTLTASSDYGYLGKQFDPTTTHYNYGYRDYNPSTSRFTTVDPIRDGLNWFQYCNGDPVNFVDLWGLFYYTKNGQKGSSSYKKTKVYVFRDNDGFGDSFNSTRMIFKNGVCVYVDQVGANCSEDNYKKGVNFTEPDGIYYYTSQGLVDNGDGTYDSANYHNVLRHKTDDPNIPEEIREAINSTPGDFLEHGNQRKQDKAGPYNANAIPRGAGCTIGKDGQEHQDEFMKILMDGVDRPEEIKKTIISNKHVQKKCNK